MGLLGFRKEVDGLMGVVGKREEEVGELLEEKRHVRRKIEVGRRLINYDTRLKELEAELVIETTGQEPIILGEEVSDSDEDEDEDEEEEGYSVSVAKLRRNVVQYRLVLGLEKELGEHPFVAAQTARVAKVRTTLLMDLSTALQQAKAAGADGSGRVMKIMKIYGDMEESAEAVQVLKSLKSS